ncbi:MAG: CPBP family intramembrane metalloprotease [Candidatus Eisenbacteria bacterium]|nr:CPBP family intramembrane metalloprotease [Candidatus Latescibacterota bacterium]MBD3303374.1 CPBP family intramembrane metalloprotease [Candidatus Eisenbacteria bacterium]
MPSLGDHLLVALIAVAYPLFFTVGWFRSGRSRLETGEADSRRRFYYQSMIELWLLTPLAIAWWLGSGRALSAVGLGLPGGWAFWGGAIVVVAIASGLGYQVATVRASADARAQVRKQFRGVSALMIPRGGGERRLWVGLSLTAGFCEEVLYRGYLLWYLMVWLPAPIAVFVSAVLFGMAHLYLGLGIGVVRATIVGVVLGAAYLLTGTLWVPIAIHAVVDVASGFTGSYALEEGGLRGG